MVSVQVIRSSVVFATSRESQAAEITHLNFRSDTYIAVARNIIAWRREAHLHEARIAECHMRGANALDVMERRLTGHSWLVGEGPTVADLALFAYTHRADEGGFELAHWPGIQAWLGRVAALPGITLLPRP